jgi:glycosyltransferase involved in cell wall biosynthesis
VGEIMEKIIQIPIEPLDERYSIQWYDWFTDAILRDTRLRLTTILGRKLTDKIEEGAFLDVCGTNYYKATQLQGICKIIHDREVVAGDTFLFHDLWFPGLEMLAYMRNALKLDFKIAGCLHAGTYDPTDYTSLVGMSSWGRPLETSWFNFVDHIFVATNYHKELILQNRPVNPRKIYVTGFPIKPILRKQQHKKNIVVFPHRLTSDKHPELFDKLKLHFADKYPNWYFVKTQEIRRTKEEYYDLLNNCKIAVSFATHENWGICMQEAVMLGCTPIVPNRLSYLEMYPYSLRFRDFEEAVSLVDEHIDLWNHRMESYEPLYILKNQIIRKGAEAIPKMLEVIHNG